MALNLSAVTATVDHLTRWSNGNVIYSTCSNPFESNVNFLCKHCRETMRCDPKDFLIHVVPPNVKAFIKKHRHDPIEPEPQIAEYMPSRKFRNE